mmetsp:Transcript_46984/g.124376  ORF Transcript_46984/g.124376 Transcript_46984/m.124376 type:complete len:180 (-) Transcript_46984:136-675(-)
MTGNCRSPSMISRCFFALLRCKASASEWLSMLRNQIWPAMGQIGLLCFLGRKRVKQGYGHARIPKMTRGVMVVENPLTAFSRRAIAELTGMRIDTFLDNELLVNITDHVLVPKHELLTTSEKAAVLTRYSIKENQLPRIMASDPVARYLGLKKGDVVKITRKSATAGRYVTYRVCDTAM